MARPTKPTPSRAGKAAPKSATRPTAKQVVASPSKDELRARVEKLERANTILRTKNRSGLTNFHEASDRVSELEAHLAKLELQLSRSSTEAKGKPAAQVAKPKRTPGRRQRAANGVDDSEDAMSRDKSGLHGDAEESMSGSIQ